jgi:hypothetical protein
MSTAILSGWSLSKSDRGLAHCHTNASTQTNAKARNSAKAPTPGQPMLCPYEFSHGIHNTVRRIGVEDDIRACTIRGPLKELGREVDWNFQGPLH